MLTVSTANAEVGEENLRTEKRQDQQSTEIPVLGTPHRDRMPALVSGPATGGNGSGTPGEGLARV